jgi:hypothetical protein
LNRGVIPPAHLLWSPAFGSLGPRAARGIPPTAGNAYGHGRAGIWQRLAAKGRSPRALERIVTDETYTNMRSEPSGRWGTFRLFLILLSTPSPTGCIWRVYS